MTKKSKGKSADQRHVEESYLMLRRIVGILAIATPFFLPIASFVYANETWLRPTISHYYHGPLQNEFVGIVCVMGVFLIAYRGYDSTDNWAGHLAGLSAIGVALCPQGNGPIGTVHYVSAGVLFLTLIYFSACRFTKSSECKIVRGSAKWNRNRVYVGSAIVMIVCLVAIGVWSLAIEDSSSSFVFWIESVLLLAFGLSWFIKGDTLLRDDENKRSSADCCWHRIREVVRSCPDKSGGND